MKIISYKTSQALFLVSIAFVFTILTSCKDDKDSCQKCDEERAEAQAKTDSIARNKDYNSLETSNEKVLNNSSTGLKTKKSPARSSDNTEENGDNVSIINPNDKSNSDSKRTYGSSGTGGGSGTSGSGGDGNGSTGWNADAKKESN